MSLSVVECLLINFILVLHPKYRRHYFERELWEQAWIDTAVSAARDVWNKHYRTRATVSLPSISRSNSSDLFAALHAPVIETICDPFDEFIAGSISNDDPIQYWTQIASSSSNGVITARQTLAEMALDFLSASATSTDVERLFSNSGLIVAKRRYNLTPKHIQQSTMLNNWIRVGSVVPRVACAKKLNTKYGKKKEGGQEEEEEDSEDDEMDGGESTEVSD